MFDPALERIIDKLTKLLKKEPTATKYRLLRSTLYLRKRDYRQALADADKAIELEPDAWNYKKRGNVYFAMKNFGAALADYCKAIELYPNIEIENVLNYFEPILIENR